MVFTVVSSEWVNKDTNEKYLLNSQSCLQNLRGGHIENVISLVWLFLFCVNVFFSNTLHFILVPIIGHHWSLGLLDIWNSCRTLEQSRLNVGWMDAWVALDWIGWLWNQEHRSRAMLIIQYNMIQYNFTIQWPTYWPNVYQLLANIHICLFFTFLDSFSLNIFAFLCRRSHSIFWAKKLNQELVIRSLHEQIFVMHLKAKIENIKSWA